MSGPTQAKQQNDPYREHLVSARKLSVSENWLFRDDTAVR